MNHNMCNSTEFTSFSHAYNYTYSSSESVFLFNTDYFVSDKNLAKEREREIPVFQTLRRKYQNFFLFLNNLDLPS